MRTLTREKQLLQKATVQSDRSGQTLTHDTAATSPQLLGPKICPSPSPPYPSYQFTLSWHGPLCSKENSISPISDTGVVFLSLLIALDLINICVYFSHTQHNNEQTQTIPTMSYNQVSHFRCKLHTSKSTLNLLQLFQFLELQMDIMSGVIYLLIENLYLEVSD